MDSLIELSWLIGLYLGFSRFLTSCVVVADSLDLMLFAFFTQVCGRCGLECTRSGTAVSTNGVLSYTTDIKGPKQYGEIPVSSHLIGPIL
jgi:hypothetical protein